MKAINPNWRLGGEGGEEALLIHITTFSSLEKGVGISVTTSDQCASVIKQAIMRAVKNMFENRPMLESIVCHT